MADDPLVPPVDAFTGRLYYMEFTLRMVVPIPLGGAPTTDPAAVQQHFGGVVHTLLRQLPFVSSFKFIPTGVPHSEEVFLPSPEAVKERMSVYLGEREHSAEENPPAKGRLIVLPGRS